MVACVSAMRAYLVEAAQGCQVCPVAQIALLAPGLDSRSCMRCALLQPIDLRDNGCLLLQETSEASGGSRSGMEGSSTARPAPNTALKAEVIAGVAGLYATPPEASQAGPAAAAAAASAAHGPSRAELKECLLELLPELDLDVVTREQCNGRVGRGGLHWVRLASGFEGIR